MRKVKLNLAATVDNYISRLDGSVDFLGNPNESEESESTKAFNKFLESINSVIMGRTTYDEYNHYGWGYLKGKRIIVLTSRDGESDDVEFYKGKLSKLIESLEGNIWCFGGTKVIKSFLELNLIDEFHITTVPHIIGKGKPLFEIGDYEMKLELKDSLLDKNVITNIYKVIK